MNPDDELFRVIGSNRVHFCVASPSLKQALIWEKRRGKRTVIQGFLGSDLLLDPIDEILGAVADGPITDAMMIFGGHEWT